MIEEEQVTGLLAAQVRADAQHLLEHVAVPDLRLDDADAGLAQRLVERRGWP